MLKALIPIVLSIVFIHLPLMYLIMHHSFEKKVTQIENNQTEKVVFVNLKQKSLPIADIQKPKVQKAPANPSAQALYDSSVKKETVSKKFSKSNTPLGMPWPQPSENNESKKTKTMEDQLKALAQTQKQKEKAKYRDRYASNTKVPPVKIQIGSPDGGNTDDYLPNYKVGNRTYLNTQANPHLAYYVELKRKFRFTWDPISVLRYETNQLSRGLIRVVWGLSVDNKGNLADLRLLRGSGMMVYDNEAKRTIKASAPFTSPPTNMIASDGMLHMAWTFVVYL